jgi:hypothetical protein
MKNLNNFIFTTMILISLNFSCIKSKIQERPSNDIAFLIKHVDTNNLKPLSFLYIQKKLGEDTFMSIGPSDYRFKSILQFSSIDWFKLKNYYNQGNTNISNRIYLDKDFIEVWFPTVADTSFVLKDNFLRPKCEVYDIENYLVGHFTRGRCFFLGGNYVIIIGDTTPK